MTMRDGTKDPVGSTPSPCVRNCCLDENDICLGCGRSISEIVGWHGATEIERKEILIRCRLRHLQRNARIEKRSDDAQDLRRST
jgi:predicted Fe-S protein YdhL (DUF1289 family)